MVRHLGSQVPTQIAFKSTANIGHFIFKDQNSHFVRPNMKKTNLWKFKLNSVSRVLGEKVENHSLLFLVQIFSFLFYLFVFMFLKDPDGNKPCLNSFSGYLAFTISLLVMYFYVRFTLMLNKIIIIILNK